MCAVAAAATRNCTVGTGVLQLPLRRTAAVAKAAATLQGVSAGRFVLGLGVGEHAEEYRRSGASFAERGAALDRAVSELRHLWQEEEGGEADASWFEQRPRPHPLPIWFGGRSVRAIDRTAAVGDGWMPIFVTPDQYAASNAQLDAALEREGRSAGQVVRAATVIVSLTDRRWRRADALEWASALWNLDPTRLERFVWSGSPEECRDALGRYRQAGAEHVSVLLATDHPVEMFRTLAW